MKINCFKAPFEYVVIEDFYDECELDLIWKELDFLTPNLKDADFTKTAQSDDGLLLKTGKGIFLDEMFSNREMSNILTLNRKIWRKDILHELVMISPWWGILNNCNKDNTLVNYYHKNHFYKAHCDITAISAVTVLFKDSTKFTGGDFKFPDYGLTIPKQSNTMILFPGPVNHEVTPVTVTEDVLGNGRYSIAQFFGIS